MIKYTIIWDFDGTILPLKPYDSEQTLLVYKLNQSRQGIFLFKRFFTRAVIYADMKHWIGKSFKRFYLWLLKGARTEALDYVAELLVENISETERRTLLQLKEDGHNMVILSCGTADLSERVLKVAGLYDCFNRIEANRFIIENDQITGMDCHIKTPEDKLKFIKAQGIRPEESIVIGDGATDIPLLDWTVNPVLIDRTGKKKDKYSGKGYHFISAIPEIVGMIEKEFA